MSLFYQPHQIEKQRKQYVCIVCKRTWSRKSEISQDCPRPERPIYSKWRTVPPHLQSRAKLHRHGLQPGGPPRAGFAYPKNHLFVYELYDVNDASCRSSSSSVSTIPLSASTGCAMTVALSSKMPMSSP